MSEMRAVFKLPKQALRHSTLVRRMGSSEINRKVSDIRCVCTCSCKCNTIRGRSHMTSSPLGGGGFQMMTGGVWPMIRHHINLKFLENF